jgi:hypothetical protein
MLCSQSQLISHRIDQKSSVGEAFGMSAANVGAEPTLKQSQELLTDQALALPIGHRAMETASITEKYRDAYPSARSFLWTWAFYSQGNAWGRGVLPGLPVAR